ncbi:PAS domain-containing protein [Nostoc sp. FACHB-110]|uniref:PAS domain-containing protein n=1 Tax=Nostoc sp. FACHB-110 TaxID=2692834 RepID=UPI001684CAEB|nr:PAS domain-containing protein [Nostoc sp. FACHB-110]MBD2440380.1 PAS domain-containing protein [Nostoc sp. FACHB-110]
MDIAKLCHLDENYQKSLLTVAHSTSVIEVIQQMNQAQTSCAVVLEQEKLIGIFTERDVVRSLANNICFVDMTIAQLMSEPVVTVSQADTENVAIIEQLFQQNCIRHLPVINSQEQVIDVITPTDLSRLMAIQCSTVINHLQSTIDAKTTELELEIALCREMTELLLEREARLNDILNSAIATSIVSFRLFPNRYAEYIYQSVGCEAIFGYTRAEILADTNLWMSRIHPQDLETVILPLFDHIFAGRTTKIEYRFAHKDNSWRWICATYTSRQDCQAKCWIVTGTSIDITEKQAAFSDRQQVEETLRRNEERWQLAIAGTDEAIWDWDILTNQTFRSERWYEMLGYARHELSEQDDEWSIRIHPDDLERVLSQQRAYLLRQTPDYHVEYRLRRQDGSYGWFRSRAKAIWNQEGKAIRLIGSLGDITERKQIETTLQEREAMLRRIGDNLPNGAIYKVSRELDGSDRFYYLSAGIENLMEVSAEAALQDSSLLYRQFLGEDVPNFQIAVEQSRQNFSVFDYQLRICTPSGKIKWLHFRSSPRALEDGRVIWDGLVVDVTDLKLTEETLRQSEARLEESQQIARLGNWDYNLATGKITWSKGLFESFNRDFCQPEPTYAENLELYHPEDRDKLAQAVACAISTGEPYKLVLRSLRADGSIMYVEGIGKAEFGVDGQVIRLYGTAQDITDRKTAEEALVESERKFRAIFNNTFQFTGLLSVEGILLEANETALIFAGLTPADVMNKPFWETHWWQISPQTQAELQQAIARAAQGNFVRYEVDILGANNRVATIDFSLRPLHDENGKVVLLIPEGRDISERQAALRDRLKTEEKLRRSEAQLATAQKIAHVGSWEWNLGDAQQTWSTETFRIFGLSPMQPAPTQAEFFQMVHPEDRQTLQSLFLWAVIEGTPFNVEYRIIRPNGLVRYVESKAEVAYNSQGRTIKLFGAILDITERKQIELEIILSRDLREAIFDESADALFLVDTETLLTIDCNQRAVELFEAASKTELIGIDGHSLQTQQFSAIEISAMVAEVSQHGFWSQEIEYVTKRGNLFWGNIAVKQLKIADKVVNLVRVSDISDRKRAEQALLEKENFLRSIYDGVAHSIFVVDFVDHDFRFVGLNYAHEQLTGFYSDEVQGKTPEAVFPSAIATAVRKHYQDCVNAQTTITYEESIPFKGQETWWITSLTPLKDENGRIYRIVASSLNITEQKRTQKMLEMQAVITRNMAEGLCLVRAKDGILVYTNPKFEQMFGYEAGELIGRHVSIINYGDESTNPEALSQKIITAVLENGTANYEVHNVKKDGTAFWSQANASVFDHPEYGTVLVAVQQDITEHKLAEEQVKTSLREKEVLLKEIHHRVKNNLGIVSSLLQMQCRRIQDSQAIAILRDSQNRIASIALVHEKLYRSADLANIDFAQYIPDLTTHLFDSYNVSSNYIKLNIQVDASLDIETAIPCGLIINEIVSNALKYAFPDNRTGEIQVGLTQENQHDFILTIRDNGIGLPADFESKKVTTLGITLVQGLVKQLKGTMEIHAQQGTEFKIKFTKSRA